MLSHEAQSAAGPPRGFYAYASEPSSVSDAISRAVRDLNGQNAFLITPWEDLAVNGVSLIDTICETIDGSQFFCADLTGLNQNVLFELGFAIARNKRIWLTADLSFNQFKADFTQFRTFTTVGYSSSQNSYEISGAFYKDQPFRDLDNTLFKRQLEQNLLRPSTKPHLLYLSSRHAIQASVDLTERVERLKYPYVIDDPLESSARTLSWYGSQVFNSFAVLCHFTHPGREDATLLNARYALVAGIALGFNKPLLILSEGFSTGAVDYREYWQSYSRATEAVKHFEHWFAPMQAQLRDAEQEQKQYREKIRLSGALAELDIGDFVAENDNALIMNFVKTQAFIEAVEGKNKIFIGRKGTGKTANLLQLRERFSDEKNTLTCVVKPPELEVEALVDCLRQLTRSSQKFAVGALWKLLLYSEIALSLKDEVESRRVGSPTADEQALISFLDGPGSHLQEALAVRLEKSIKSIERAAAQGTKSIATDREAITGALQGELLARLRDLITRSLSTRRRIVVLVDNLDKGWDRESDLRDLSHLLFGLLQAVEHLPTDLAGRQKGEERIKVNVAVFLRSDIFHRVLLYVKEADKISHTKIAWNDPELLLKVIQDRFYNSSTLSAPENMWAKYFTENVNGVPVKEFIFRKILHRPRDLMFLIGRALEQAINREHTKIEENDLTEALKAYSYFALDSINVENEMPKYDLREVCLEFLQCRPTLSYKELVLILRAGGVQKEEVRDMIRELTLLSFLGIETEAGEFRFVEEPRDYSRLEALARHRTSGDFGARSYRINEPFWANLEICDPNLGV